MQEFLKYKQMKEKLTDLYRAMRVKTPQIETEKAIRPNSNGEQLQPLFRSDHVNGNAGTDFSTFRCSVFLSLRVARQEGDETLAG